MVKKAFESDIPRFKIKHPPLSACHKVVEYYCEKNSQYGLQLINIYGYVDIIHTSYVHRKKVKENAKSVNSGSF